MVTNGVELSRFQPRSKGPTLFRGLGLNNKCVAGYIGQGLAHALETVLKASDLQEKILIDTRGVIY